MPPEPIDGRRTATEPTADDPARAAAHTARRHAPSPRPRRDPHVLPRHDRTTPASVHTAARRARALRTSRRLTLGHPTAEPMHWCTRLHPSLHPAPAQHPCAGARPRRSARPSHRRQACSERLGRARGGLRPSKTTHDSVSHTFCRVVLGEKPPHTSRERAAAMTDVYVIVTMCARSPHRHPGDLCQVLTTEITIGPIARSEHVGRRGLARGLPSALSARTNTVLRTAKPR